MTRRQEQDGQILVLFVAVLILLLAMAAVAIDVSNAYAARRAYRTAADAAALAGGQELQVGLTKAIGDPQYVNARAASAEALRVQLGGTASVCTTTGTTATCTFTGTPYTATIRTPINGGDCVSCVPARSVEVKVNNPAFQLSFARVFGIDSYAVSVGAVAGMSFKANYALMTLRPPKPLPNGLDQNREDINLNGHSTVLNIVEGDVGTNTYIGENQPSEVMLRVASGYTLDHYDDISPDGWNKDSEGNPQGRLITELILDPDYVNSAAAPSRTGVPVYTTVADGVDAACTDVPAAISSDPETTCYKPGVYAGSPSQVFSVNSTQIAYLEPGMYFFDRGAQISGSLYGGLVDGQGVSIWVPKDVSFDALNAVNFVLNTADVTPARDGASVAQVTPEGLLLTLQVQRDNACFSGLTPILCADNQNDALKIGGNSQFHVGGVIYGPSDNMQINSASTTQTGTAGQIISWTATYSGGATLNQSYPANYGPGLLRLDGACTAPGTPCAP